MIKTSVDKKKRKKITFALAWDLKSEEAKSCLGSTYHWGALWWQQVIMWATNMCMTWVCLKWTVTYQSDSNLWLLSEPLAHFNVIALKGEGSHGCPMWFLLWCGDDLTIVCLRNARVKNLQMLVELFWVGFWAKVGNVFEKLYSLEHWD